jgi:hypothetical protein
MSRLCCKQEGIKNARLDITIASLYAGTGGGPEAEFMETLANAAKRSTETPKITVLLDALRSTRPSKTSAGKHSMHM